MKREKGFTLVELLVVIAIIGLLISIMLPSVQKIMEQGRRVKCGVHLKGISTGITQYVSPAGGGGDGRSPSMYTEDWAISNSSAAPSLADSREDFWADETECNLQSMYLLVQLGLAYDNHFSCPSNSAKTYSKDPDQWGFESWENSSFGFNITARKYHSYAGHKSQNGFTPLAADQGDLDSGAAPNPALPNANHGWEYCNVLNKGGDVQAHSWSDMEENIRDDESIFSGFGYGKDDIYDYTDSGDGGASAAGGDAENVKKPNDSYIYSSSAE